MIKRLFAIALLGAALVACTPSDSGSSPDVDPSLDAMPSDVLPSDALPSDALPSDDMMSAEPS
jgi:hypothetical protein